MTVKKNKSENKSNESIQSPFAQTFFHGTKNSQVIQQSLTAQNIRLKLLVRLLFGKDTHQKKSKQ